MTEPTGDAQRDEADAPAPVTGRPRADGRLGNRGVRILDMAVRERPRWEGRLPVDPELSDALGGLALRRAEVAELRRHLDAATVAMVEAERTLANEAWRRHGEDACERAFDLAWEEAGPERIAGAAIMTRDGRMATLPPPGRHHHLIFLLAIEGHPPIGPGAQGFATTWGRFVGRREGLAIAEANGQIVAKHPSFDKLYSEDMW